MSSFLSARLNLARLASALCLVALFGLAPRATAHAQPPAPTTLVISQVYTRGGESGAAFRNDFVEIFNAGTTPVNAEGWSVYVRGLNGDSTGFGAIFFPFPKTVEPGQYLLVRMGSGGTSGAVLPTADANALIGEPFFNIDAEGAVVALVRPNATGPTGNGCPSPPANGVADLVGFGNASCTEGGSAAPAPGLSTALFRRDNGCEETDRNAADFQLADAAPRNINTTRAPCGPAQQLGFINFAPPGLFGDAERFGRAQVTVRRTGSLAAAATVDYEAAGVTASERDDYTTALGRLRFAPGESQKTFDVLLTDDSRQEANETVELRLSNPTGEGVSLGLGDKARLTIIDDDNPPPATNRSDDSFAFVQQHYHDFLNRQPDIPGLIFWGNGIERCGADTQCREVKRIDTSAAFFLSIEFQNTGFLVHRLYRAALPETPARPRALPRYHEFIRDTQELGRNVVVGRAGWEQQLESNTQLLLADFVARPEFLARYPPTMSPAEYVDALDAQAGSAAGVGRVLTAGQRDALAAALEAGHETRAGVLRQLAEHRTFADAERNRAFVLMQYIGYLRRSPDAAPDTNFDGYDFWLQKLDSFNGNYVEAEMVKAFITSIEYRQRFGQ